MKRERTASRQTGQWIVPVVVLLGAVAASGACGVLATRLWGQMPIAQLERLESARVRAAFTAAQSGMTRDARQGEALLIISWRLAEALRDPARADAPEVQQQVARLAAEVTDSSAARLERAAFELIALERDGVEPPAWAERVAPYLEGLETAGFAHHFGAFVDHRAAVYRKLGLEPVTARQFAALEIEQKYGQPHGLFLQGFVPRLEKLAAHNADPAAAAYDRRLARRLLREWTLERGAPHLRLLAADLLADSLDAGGAPPPQHDVVQALRAWRAAYRDAASRRPNDVLGLRQEPTLCPNEEGRRIAWLVLTSWTASATVAAALLGLLLGWLWPLRGTTAVPKRPALLGGATLTLVLLLAGLLWTLLWPDAVREDLRRPAADRLWLHPLAAAVSAIVLIAATSLSPWPRWSVTAGRIPRIAATAATTWLLLALATFVCGVGAWITHGQHQRALANALDDPIAAMAGADADRLLDPLRAWNPLREQ